ncbi:diacylglycerol kinase, partial [Limosilactobacillus mucosae]|nr:diacylglycerol kinase [Limosilactobacillus mucosae]
FLHLNGYDHEQKDDEEKMFKLQEEILNGYGSQDKHQVEKNRHFIQALGHAWDGVKDVVKKERNMRFHIVAAILVIIVAFWLQVNV